jgi:hypothetical protein
VTDRAITEEGRRVEEARNGTPWRTWGPYGDLTFGGPADRAVPPPPA